MALHLLLMRLDLAMYADALGETRHSFSFFFVELFFFNARWIWSIEATPGNRVM